MVQYPHFDLDVPSSASNRWFGLVVWWSGLVSHSPSTGARGSNPQFPPIQTTDGHISVRWAPFRSGFGSVEATEKEQRRGNASAELQKWNEAAAGGKRPGGGGVRLLSLPR